jgi:hypothetical protein
MCHILEYQQRRGRMERAVKRLSARASEILESATPTRGLLGFGGPGLPPLTTPLRDGPVLFQNERKRSPNPTLIQSEKYRRSIVFQKRVEYDY